MAPAYFHRRFRSTFGLTPHEYMLRRRMDLARHLLGDPALRVAEVAEAVGYDNPFYFSRVFRRHFGFPPSSRESV
jgi:AraC-like DNA-binding protein